MNTGGRSAPWVVERYVALGDSFTAGASEAQLRAATWSEPAGGAGADAPVPWPHRLAELLRIENARLD